MSTLEEVIGSFGREIDAQCEHGGLPRHEHAIHFCFALAAQRAVALPPGSIVFEHGSNGRLVDLWIAPLRLAAEIKFSRPIPSERNRPLTQFLGALLRDLQKVLALDADERLVILACDQPAPSYLQGNTHGVLPLALGGELMVTREAFNRLAPTARSRALMDGRWDDARVSVAWSSHRSALHIVVWRVVRASSATATSSR